MVPNDLIVIDKDLICNIHLEFLKGITEQFNPSMKVSLIPKDPKIAGCEAKISL